MISVFCACITRKRFKLFFFRIYNYLYFHTVKLFEGFILSDRAFFPSSDHGDMASKTDLHYSSTLFGCWQHFIYISCMPSFFISGGGVWVEKWTLKKEKRTWYVYLVVEVQHPIGYKVRLDHWENGFIFGCILLSYAVKRPCLLMTVCWWL